MPSVAASADTSTRHLFRNSGWLIAEHGLRFVSAVFVGLWMARHLGPERFGRLSVLMTAVLLFAMLARAGVDTLLLRELVAAPERESRLMAAARRAIGFSGVASAGVLLIVAWMVGAGTSEIVIVAFAIAVQPLSVNDSLLQARRAMSTVVISRVISIAAVALLRVALILADAPLVLFALSILLEQALSYLLMARAVRRFRSTHDVTGAAAGKPTADEISALLAQSWPTLAAAVATLAQTRVDQYLVYQLAGATQAGIYAASVRFYDAWIAVPTFVSIAFLPGLIAGPQSSAAQVEQRFVLLYRMLVGASLVVALVTTLLAPWIVTLTLGHAFDGAADVLSISIFAGLFSAMGSVNARYFVAHGLQRKLAVRAAVSALLSLTLNLWSIPRHGIVGSAWVTLTALATANYLLDFIDRDLAPLRRIKAHALFGWPMSSRTRGRRP